MRSRRISTSKYAVEVERSPREEWQDMFLSYGVRELMNAPRR